MSYDEQKQLFREKIRTIPPYLRKYYGEVNIVFDPHTDSIERWTNTIKPSYENIFPLLNTEWICVSNPTEGDRDEDDSNEGDVEDGFCGEEYDPSFN